jgi:hypothetical protein
MIIPQECESPQETQKRTQQTQVMILSQENQENEIQTIKTPKRPQQPIYEHISIPMVADGETSPRHETKEPEEILLVFNELDLPTTKKVPFKSEPCHKLIEKSWLMSSKVTQKCPIFLSFEPIYIFCQ